MCPHTQFIEHVVGVQKCSYNHAIIGLWCSRENRSMHGTKAGFRDRRRAATTHLVVQAFQRTVWVHVRNRGFGHAINGYRYPGIHRSKHGSKAGGTGRQDSVIGGTLICSSISTTSWYARARLGCVLTVGHAKGATVQGEFEAVPR
jgi:hypothetical protein